MQQAIELTMGIALLVMAVFLVIVVLMQSGKDKRLSGAIAGGSDNFFGKSKGHKKDKTLSFVTTALSFVFVILVVIMYIVVA